MSEDRGFLGDTWAFTKSVGSGAWNAGAGMVEGVKGLAKGGYKLATDAEAREKAWETTKELAEAAKNYGGAVYDDPGKAYRDARDGTLAAIDKFEKARDLAETEGRLAEFYGEITGAGIFEIATAVVPVGALAKAGRLGKVVNAADDVADMAKVIRKVENAENVLSSGQKAKRVVGKSVIIEPDTKSSSIAKCSLDKGVVGVKNAAPPKKKLGTPKPSPAEINLAKSSGKTAAHIAAREKVARNYLENNGFTKDQIKDALGKADGTVIGGVDLNKPIEIVSFPPPDSMTQYVKSHGYPGNWFDPKGAQTADALGISDEGRKLISVKMPKGDGLSSQSKPILDKWTNPKNPIQTQGGGQQIFVNDSVRNEVIQINKIGS